VTNDWVYFIYPILQLSSWKIRHTSAQHCEVDNQLEEKYIHEDFVCMHDSWETIKKFIEWCIETRKL
jgi:hypothetical protein